MWKQIWPDQTWVTFPFCGSHKVTMVILAMAKPKSVRWCARLNRSLVWLIRLISLIGLITMYCILRVKWIIYPRLQNFTVADFMKYFTWIIISHSLRFYEIFHNCSNISYWRIVWDTSFSTNLTLCLQNRNKIPCNFPWIFIPNEIITQDRIGMFKTQDNQIAANLLCWDSIFSLQVYFNVHQSVKKSASIWDHLSNMYVVEFTEILKIG